MNATTEATGRPAGFDPSRPGVDVLPERNGERMALTWHAASGDHSPQAGFAKIEGKRDSTVYVVTEFPTTWGRGFFLSKFVSKPGTRAGTDKGAEGYSVLCSKDGPEKDVCECKGAVRWGHCKHKDCIRTLLANGWL